MPGSPRLLAEADHRGRDVAEVLGDEVEPARAGRRGRAPARAAARTSWPRVPRPDRHGPGRSKAREAAADALDALVRAVRAAADEHRVTFLESDIDRDGGRIILVSGAPQTFGDDEERMLRTVRAIVDAGLPLPVHIGVSEGRVFTGQVGASFRKDLYRARRHCGARGAADGARRRGRDLGLGGALTRGGGSFHATELEPLTSRGRAEPVQAFVLGELVPESARTEPGPAEEKLPFVDRERERAVLAASVAPVRMGFGTLVELVGEPGIGKSRLAQELRENCADMRQISLRCEQYESSTPYYPFRPFLRSLLDVELNGGGEHNRTVLSERLAPIDEELVPWTLSRRAARRRGRVDARGDDLDPAFWRARLHGVMGTLLGHLLDSPTLLVFDDVHWMDDASSELLRYLGTQLPTRPWLACTTRRGVEGGFAAAEGTPPLPALTLRLEPLPVDDAKTLVHRGGGWSPADRRGAGGAHGARAGNPLFLQERLARASARRRTRPTSSRRPSSHSSPRASIGSPRETGACSAGHRSSALVLGALIAEVLEDDTGSLPAPSVGPTRRVRRARSQRRRGLPLPPCSHPRRRLRGLSYRRRRELHGRVAEVIEQRQAATRDAAEQLSLHFFRAERWPTT